MSDQSVAALEEFLRYLGKKGFLTPAVAANRRAAVGKLFDVLQEDEKGDVFALDFDSVVSRFTNLGKQVYKPGSMQAYISRTRSSVEDFRRYLDDPVNFKMAMPTMQKPQKLKKKTASESSSAEPPEPESALDRSTGTKIIRESVFPIPIRKDLTVKIYGLPFDMTEAEAKKIANVVMAMVA